MNKLFTEYIFFPNLHTADKTPKFDMLCVYNDSKCFDELIESIKQQKCKYCIRMIACNNNKGLFSSMASAYNEMVKSVVSKQIIFTHQDIRFKDVNTLEHVLEEALAISDDSVWGIAGAINYSKNNLNSFECSSSQEVSTIDECLFGMSTSLCRSLTFNEKLCDNWHLYSVEICLHNFVEGGKSYVVSASNVCHLSSGIVSLSYIKTLCKLVNHYKSKGLKTIWTTCAKVDLESPYHLYIMMYLIKHTVLNKIIRPLRKNINKSKKGI